MARSQPRGSRGKKALDKLANGPWLQRPQDNKLEGLPGPGSSALVLKGTDPTSWGAAAAAGHIIEDEGVPLPQRTYLDFVGAGVTATDNLAGDKTIVTIPGAGSTGATFSSQVLGEASLVSYWPLNEASGNAIDYGPTNKPLTAGGTPTYGQGGPFATTTDTSILFDSAPGTTLSAIDHFLDQSGGTSPYDFNTRATFTWEGIVYLTAYPATLAPVLSNGAQRGAGSIGGITLAIFSTGAVIFYRAGVALTGSAIPLSQWVHLAISYDGTNRSIYINGGLDIVSASTANESTVKPFALGFQEDNTTGYYTYEGRLAQVAVYSTALSAATILAHAQAGILSAVTLSNVRTVSSAYTVNASDGIILASGTTTVTLPTAVTQSGRRITIKNVGVNTVTVGRTSSEKIDGSAADISLATAKQAREFVSDGFGWQITASYL